MPLPRRITKIGTSLGITIPRGQLETLGLRRGDLVFCGVFENQLVIWKVPEDAQRPPMVARGADTPPLDGAGDQE